MSYSTQEPKNSISKPKKEEKMRYTLTYFEVPSEVKQVVQPLLDRFAPICDGVVDRIHVYFVTDVTDEGALTAISARREYRGATIYIFPRLLDFSPEERAEAICHEFCHIITDPLHTVVNEVVENFVEAGVKDYVLENVRQANEKVVEDLSRLLIDVKVKEG